MIKSYGTAIFFDQYGMVRVERGKKPLLNEWLVYPDGHGIENLCEYMDMIDVRTGLSVWDTANGI